MATFSENATLDATIESVSMDGAGDTTVVVSVKRQDGSLSRLRHLRCQSAANGGKVVDEQGASLGNVPAALRNAITSFLAQVDTVLDSAAQARKI